jgi:osmotically-inducible protein OsmY
MAKSRKRIKSDVEKQLARDTRVESSDVSIQVDETGKVSLTGSVPYFRDRKEAQKIASKILGVTALENNLEVDFSEDDVEFKDYELEKNIEEALLNQTVIAPSRLDISVKDGNAVIKGSVEKYWKKSLVEELISQIRGIRTIENNIAVVPTDTKTDEQIARDIEGALERDISADADRIDVLVENGIVTFEGVVSSWIAKEAAFAAAEATAGVKDIIDNLSISY